MPKKKDMGMAVMVAMNPARKKKKNSMCPECKEAYRAGERKEYKKEKKWEDKVSKVMREFDAGKLHSGSKKGPKVKNRRQAIAIAMSEAQRQQRRKKRK